MNNIWGTVEADAWGRGFCYSDYEELCKRANKHPLCVTAFHLLVRAFDAQHEFDCNLGEEDV